MALSQNQAIIFASLMLCLTMIYVSVGVKQATVETYLCYYGRGDRFGYNVSFDFDVVCYRENESLACDEKVYDIEYQYTTTLPVASVRPYLAEQDPE